MNRHLRLAVPVFCLVWALFLPVDTFSQEKTYKVACIGFYNVENLFDTLDSPNGIDEYFTPNGSNVWTPERYQEKLSRLAQVISEIGVDRTPDGLAVLGVAEVENRQVLEDLVKQPAIRARNYQIIHYDSPDARGIDVALLYNPKYFTPTAHRAFPLMLQDDAGERILTRDQLLVSGTLDGEEMHLIVNHWPSRRGGEERSRPLRIKAAQLSRQLADSLRQQSPQAGIVVMGDMNDDPVNHSCREYLGGRRKVQQVKTGDFYNPMFDMFKQGLGTLAYRDAWSLFDQIMLSHTLLRDRSQGYFYYKTGIYNPKYLQQKSGAFKGYPYRTYVGPNYMGGYSDHFPVYVYLLKEV